MIEFLDFFLISNIAAAFSMQQIQVPNSSFCERISIWINAKPMQTAVAGCGTQLAYLMYGHVDKNDGAKRLRRADNMTGEFNEDMADR